MIKHSEFDFAYDYLRFDTTWKFEWDSNDINNETIRFYPFTEEGSSKTWYFKANNSEAAIKNHNEFMWDPKQPYLEYMADNVAGWDAGHPKNPTRYLSPGSSIIKLTNTIETVVIDTIPPEFVSDKGTEYVWISGVNGDKTKEKRHCTFIFRDQAGLDFKHFGVFVESKRTVEAKDFNALSSADFKKDTGNLYYYNRKTNTPYYNKEKIDPSSIKIKSDGFHTYQIDFDLLYGMTDDEVKTLNETGLSIVVWDVAGNFSVYNFGECSKKENGFEAGHKWILIDEASDLADLEPCVIKYYNAEPSNRIVNENTVGSVWVSIFNPNLKFRCIDMVSQLETTSIGKIDLHTVDYSTYEKDGLIKFKVINIDKHGDVITQAWLRTGNPNFDGMLRTSTFAEVPFGPWIVRDAEGRKYDICRYVPKYLKNTDYYSFVEFFELYLNTLYTDLTKGTNISILEKIAKINNFNDVDLIEHALLWHYAKSHGMEFDIDLQTMLDLNLGFFSQTYITQNKRDDAGNLIPVYEEDENGNKKQKMVNGEPVWETEKVLATALTARTENDVLDIVKYALKNLPMYNQIKGSEKGMVMAFKMFALSCKVINLWAKLGPTVETDPEFVEEDRMYDFTSHFLTSRFNIELSTLSVDFPTFNDNIWSFIKFVKSIKPLVRILNLIKYTIIFEYDNYWLVNQRVNDDTKMGGGYCYEYDIKWKNNQSSLQADERETDVSIGSIDEMVERSEVDWHRMHATRIWLNYNADVCEIRMKTDNPEKNDYDPPDHTNLYTLFNAYLANCNGKFGFEYNDTSLAVKYGIKIYSKLCGMSVADVSTDFQFEHECPLAFKCVFSLNDVNMQPLDTGFYIYPKTGELSTYLADFVKPTYFLNEEINKLVDQSALRKMIMDPSTWEKLGTAYNVVCKDYSELPVEKKIKNITKLPEFPKDPTDKEKEAWIIQNLTLTPYIVSITSDPTLSTKIEHVPGTEIFRCTVSK